MIARIRRTALLAAALPAALWAPAHASGTKSGLEGINHFVVIYQENHSFDNLFGGWEGVEGVKRAGGVPQVDQAGDPFSCLPQVDVNLRPTSPDMATCADPSRGIRSVFPNGVFPIERYIAASDRTCPKPNERLPFGATRGLGETGGCTMDLDHRFYQERYQIDGGRMDRYVTGSNAAGLTMGYYDTRNLPIYRYLHGKDAPRYVIADNFFQAAFGGSFLNHQWLIAARTPQWPGAVNDGGAHDLHSVVDASGMPKKTPFYGSKEALKDGPLTASCAPAPGRGATPAGQLCGDFAVNTIQPAAWPYDPAAKDPALRLPPLADKTIGDLLTAAGKQWAWYSGGWADAEGDPKQPGFTRKYGETCSSDAYDNDTGTAWPRCPDKTFQFHHQPFNYYAAYGPGTKARSEHLRDEEEFRRLVKNSGKACNLPDVCFVKPLGANNEHPGYASEAGGNRHVVELLRAVEKSACARDTMIIVTYDEFGGFADHVPPPSAANPIAPYDQWGPGTRIPALVIAPNLPRRCGVDHTAHDTTSILSTLEHRFGLPSLTTRDAAARDLSTIYTAQGCR